MVGADCYALCLLVCQSASGLSRLPSMEVTRSAYNIAQRDSSWQGTMYASENNRQVNAVKTQSGIRFKIHGFYAFIIAWPCTNCHGGQIHRSRSISHSPVLVGFSAKILYIQCLADIVCLYFLSIRYRTKIHCDLTSSILEIKVADRFTIEKIDPRRGGVQD